MTAIDLDQRAEPGHAGEHGSFAAARRNLAAAFTATEAAADTIATTGIETAEAFATSLASIDETITALHHVRRAIEAGIERAVEARYPALVREIRVLNARVAELEAERGEPGRDQAPTEPLPAVRTGRGRRGMRRRQP